MKRIAGTFMLLASLGGCMQTGQKPPNRPFAQVKPSYPQKVKGDSAPYTGPYGEPIAAGNLPKQGMSPGLMTAGFVAGNGPKAGSNLIQMGYLEAAGDCSSCAPGSADNANAAQSNPEAGLESGATEGTLTGKHGKGAKIPLAPGYPFWQRNDGILPVPPQGPPGAVAAIGALPASRPTVPLNARTSVNFSSPDGMRVTWYGPSGWIEQPLVTPARYNFIQGGIYRLRLSSIVNRLERVYYPTLEVVPAQDTTATYLAHSSVPVTFTDEDFEQVDSGNFLVKVVYLPNPNNQDIATVVGPNELVSTRLEPGIDPIVEAQRRGTILLIVRLGNIDLATPNSPPMDAPNPYMMNGFGPGVPPGAMPPGGMPAPGAAPPGVMPIPTPKMNPGPNTSPMIIDPTVPGKDGKMDTSLPLGTRSGSRADRPSKLPVFENLPGKSSIGEPAPDLQGPSTQDGPDTAPKSTKPTASKPTRPLAFMP